VTGASLNKWVHLASPADAAQLEKLFELRGQALMDFYACDLETLKGFYKT
jgi:hypothetical protein